MKLGALEAGGTKMVCSVGDEHGHVQSRVSFPTKAPGETMPHLIDFFRNNEVEALGIGSFGPLDLNPASQSYGAITSTPKPGWHGYPLLKTLQSALNVPAAIDTDVNAAALAEWLLGAGKGLNNLLYVTIGTGVGGGIVSMGNLVHGLVHPEFGHMLLRPDPRDPMPDGACPYHKGCLEGLAAGPSIEKRFEVPAAALKADHLAWELETEYLAQMCVNAIVSFSPEIIVLGGGVMQQKHLFPPIRKRVQELLNGYVAHEKILSGIDTYIMPPGLDINSGVAGALLLAARAVQGMA